MPPVIAIFFVDDTLAVVCENLLKGFERLIFEFESIDEEEHTAGVAGAEEEFDEGSSRERFASPGGHLKQEAVSAAFHSLLDGADGFLLIRAEDYGDRGVRVSNGVGIFIFCEGPAADGNLQSIAKQAEDVDHEVR